MLAASAQTRELESLDNASTCRVLDSFTRHLDAIMGLLIFAINQPFWERQRRTGAGVIVVGTLGVERLVKNAVTTFCSCMSDR